MIDNVEKHYTGVAAIVKELDNSSVTLDFDPRLCFEALKVGFMTVLIASQ